MLDDDGQIYGFGTLILSVFASFHQGKGWFFWIRNSHVWFWCRNHVRNLFFRNDAVFSGLVVCCTIFGSRHFILHGALSHGKGFWGLYVLIASSCLHRCQPTFHMDINSWCSRQIAGHSKVSVILHYGGSVCSQTRQICAKICFQSIFQARIAEVFGIIIHSLGLLLRCSPCEIYTTTLARSQIWSQITLLCCEGKGVSGRSASWIKRKLVYTVVYTACVYVNSLDESVNSHVDPFDWSQHAHNQNKIEAKQGPHQNFIRTNCLPLTFLVVCARHSPDNLDHFAAEAKLCCLERSGATHGDDEGSQGSRPQEQSLGFLWSRSDVFVIRHVEFLGWEKRCWKVMSKYAANTWKYMNVIYN